VTYRDVNGERLSAAEFFAALSDGDLISAEGREVSDNWLAADEIDFESP